MLSAVLFILVLLWLLGYLSVGGLTIPNIILFSINGRAISLWNILVFLVILWAIELLPSPFREIAALLLILWLLSIFGILAFTGLSDLLVIVIIVGIVIALLQGNRIS